MGVVCIRIEQPHREPPARGRGELAHAAALAEDEAAAAEPHEAVNDRRAALEPGGGFFTRPL
jgi:hypothetical protein